MDDPRYDAARDPSSPFYEGDRTAAEPNPDPSDDGAYKVGPGRPPKQHTWKKGDPSPNPKGRPKKVPSMEPDLKKAFEDALNEKVPVKKGDKEVMLTKAVLGIQQLVNQFAKGCRYARRDVIEYSARFGVELQGGKELIAEALSTDDQAIVDAFLQRHRSPAAAADDTHVKAPPDLLDDDAAKTAGATPATPPPPKKRVKVEDEPVLDENGNPLPVNDIRYIRTMNERYVAQEKKNREGES
jgi:hypothetical protein